MADEFDPFEEKMGFNPLTGVTAATPTSGDVSGLDDPMNTLARQDQDIYTLHLQAPQQSRMSQQPQEERSTSARLPQLLPQRAYSTTTRSGVDTSALQGQLRDTMGQMAGAHQRLGLAEATAAEADVDVMDRLARRMEQAAAERKRALLEFSKSQAGLSGDISRRISELENAKPKDFFDAKGAPGGILAMVGVALGSAAQAVSRRQIPNGAMQLLDRAVASHMQNEKLRLQSKRHALAAKQSQLGLNRATFGTEQAARSATEAQIRFAMAAEIDRNKAKLRGKTAKDAASILAGNQKLKGYQALSRLMALGPQTTSTVQGKKELKDGKWVEATPRLDPLAALRAQKMLSQIEAAKAHATFKRRPPNAFTKEHGETMGFLKAADYARGMMKKLGWGGWSGLLAKLPYFDNDSKKMVDAVIRPMAIQIRNARESGVMTQPDLENAVKEFMETGSNLEDIARRMAIVEERVAMAHLEKLNAHAQSQFMVGPHYEQFKKSAAPILRRVMIPQGTGTPQPAPAQSPSYSPVGGYSPTGGFR